jgi:hypothetical protein
MEQRVVKKGVADSRREVVGMALMLTLLPP